ncbi:MAG: hypothetical protein ACRCZ9_02320 [Fusobacteriaceae bacterium]
MLLDNVDDQIIEYYARRLNIKRKNNLEGEIISIIKDFQTAIMSQPIIENDLEISTIIVDGKEKHIINYDQNFDADVTVPNFDDCLFFLYDKAVDLSNKEIEKKESKKVTVGEFIKSLFLIKKKIKERKKVSNSIKKLL